MPDVFPSSTRSFIMSQIRSKWTAQERTIHGFLKGRKTKHRMHPHVPGKPDLVVSPHLAVYLHGCFWHGCPKCYVPPKSRPEYWNPKIRRNRLRDRRNAAAARTAGYRVLFLWEHEIKRSTPRCVARILKSAALTGRR